MLALQLDRGMVGVTEAILHVHTPIRQEKPLALADVGSIRTAAAGHGLEAFAGLGVHDLSRLAGCLGLSDGADRSHFGDAGDEAVPFVVAARNLLLS